MKRRLRLIALGVFALLTVATVALWVRSHRVGDTWYVYDPPGGNEWRLSGAGGVAGFYRVTWDPETAPEGVTKSKVQRSYSRRKSIDWDRRVTVLRRDDGMRRLGPILGAVLLFKQGGAGWPSYRHWEVMVPYRLPFALLAAATAWAAWRPVREWVGTRRRPGECAACGYDLRATPRQCPECGAVPAGA